MGIKNINTAIKKLCSTTCNSIFYSIELEMFSGKTIGIDWFNWFFTYGPIAIKIIVDNMDDIFSEPTEEQITNQIIKELATFSNKLLKYNINILWICDGVSQDNKTVTKVERRKKREELYDKVKNAKETLASQNILEMDPKLLDFYKKNKPRVTFITPAIREKVENVIKEIGMPFIVSQDEAENLGSSLCKEGKIHALWTSDTDAYPLECKLVVKGFERKNNKDYINAVNVKKIREGLKFSCEEFRDYCILLGTDFNDPIDRIGGVKGYDMISKHKSLETAEQNSKYTNEIRNMKYLEVRKQLTPYETTFIREELMLDPQKKINLSDEILDIPGIIDTIVNIKQFKL